MLQNSLNCIPESFSSVCNKRQKRSNKAILQEEENERQNQAVSFVGNL